MAINPNPELPERLELTQPFELFQLDAKRLNRTYQKLLNNFDELLDAEISTIEQKSPYLVNSINEASAIIDSNAQFDEEEKLLQLSSYMHGVAFMHRLLREQTVRKNIEFPTMPFEAGTSLIRSISEKVTDKSASMEADEIMYRTLLGANQQLGTLTYIFGKDVQARYPESNQQFVTWGAYTVVAGLEQALHSAKLENYYNR